MSRLYIVDVTGDLESLVTTHMILTKLSNNDKVVLAVNPKSYNNVFCYAAVQIVQYFQSNYNNVKVVYTDNKQNKQSILFDAKDIIRITKLFEVAQKVYEEEIAENRNIKEIRIVGSLQKELLTARLWSRLLQAYTVVRTILINVMPVRVVIEYPVANMSLQQIVAYIKQYNLPYHLTWSCLDPVEDNSNDVVGYRPCNVCMTCQIRKQYRNYIQNINDYVLEVSNDVLNICAPCLNSEQNNGNENTECNTIQSIIIPLYAYPGVYATEYNKLLTLDSNGREVIVIVNPLNGPGTSRDPNYALAITRLKERGYKVIGYVYTNYGNRSFEVVTEDMEKWYEFYPNIDGFFFDEVANTTDMLHYYVSIYHYVKQEDKLVVLNPGTIVPPEYYDVADKIVIFENDYRQLNDNYFLLTNQAKACYLIYGTPNNKVDDVLQLLTQNRVSCAYITDKNATDPELWARVSPYIDKIVNMRICNANDLT